MVRYTVTNRKVAARMAAMGAAPGEIVSAADYALDLPADTMISLYDAWDEGRIDSATNMIIVEQSEERCKRIVKGLNGFAFQNAPLVHNGMLQELDLSYALNGNRLQYAFIDTEVPAQANLLKWQRVQLQQALAHGALASFTIMRTPRSSLFGKQLNMALDLDGDNEMVRRGRADLKSRVKDLLLVSKATDASLRCLLAIRLAMPLVNLHVEDWLEYTNASRGGGSSMLLLRMRVDRVSRQAIPQEMESSFRYLLHKYSSCNVPAWRESERVYDEVPL